MPSEIGSFILYLQELGVYDYFLPFLLIFAIIFAILEKTNILGDKTNINVVVSMVIGLLLVVQQPIVGIINSFLPRASLIIIVILVSILVISLIGGSHTGYTGSVFSIAAILIIIALIWAISPDLGFNLNISERTRNFIIIIVLIGLAIAFVARKPSTAGEGSLTRLAKHLESGLKGGGNRP